jgi:hypothetical protein
MANKGRSGAQFPKEKALGQDQEAKEHQAELFQNES